MQVTQNELKKQRAAVGVAKTQARGRERGERSVKSDECRLAAFTLSVAWLVAHEFTLEFAGASHVAVVCHVLALY